MSSPAPTSNTSESATSKTTSELRSRCERPDVCRLPSFNESLRLGFETLQGRSKAENNSAKQRKPQGKRKHSEIEAQLVPAGSKPRSVAWIGSTQSIDAPKANQNPQHAANQRNDHALSQQLPNNAPATCAQRGTQRDLFLTSARAREHQIGNIRAGN